MFLINIVFCIVIITYFLKYKKTINALEKIDFLHQTW